jgi:hypothetical protein
MLILLPASMMLGNPAELLERAGFKNQYIISAVTIY